MRLPRLWTTPRSFFGKRNDELASLPGGMRIYVTGDIHGRFDLLQKMDALIRSHSESVDSSTNVLWIFLGDYVDRGPDSRAVIDFLASGHVAAKTLFLRGNHEEMLMECIDDTQKLDDWRRIGGTETLASYGVPVTDVLKGRGFDEAREEFARSLPDDHLAFFHGTRLSVSYGDYFFCHAGVRPGIPLEEQVEADLLWIRDPFLRSTDDFGKIVVHGHTPVEKPDVRANRINVDTGAFATSVLTTLVLEKTNREFLSVR